MTEETAHELEECWWHFLICCAFWGLALAIVFRA